MPLISRRTLLRAGGAAATLPLLGARAFAQDPLKVAFVFVGPVADFEAILREWRRSTSRD